jgi:hypothetical protein
MTRPREIYTPVEAYQTNPLKSAPGEGGLPAGLIHARNSMGSRAASVQSEDIGAPPSRGREGAMEV